MTNPFRNVLLCAADGAEQMAELVDAYLSAEKIDPEVKERITLAIAGLNEQLTEISRDGQPPSERKVLFLD